MRSSALADLAYNGLVDPMVQFYKYSLEKLQGYVQTVEDLLAKSTQELHTQQIVNGHLRAAFDHEQAVAEQWQDRFETMYSILEGLVQETGPNVRAEIQTAFETAYENDGDNWPPELSGIFNGMFEEPTDEEIDATLEDEMMQEMIREIDRDFPEPDMDLNDMF